MRQAHLSMRRRRPPREPRLGLPEGGRTRTLTLRADDLPDVRRALAAYAAARAELDRVADEAIAALVARLAARRGGRDR